MNFPLENPFYQFLYHLVNTAGIGGLIVSFEAVLIILAVFFGLRWIAGEAKAEESEAYAYPTPALHQHHDQD